MQRHKVHQCVTMIVNLIVQDLSDNIAVSAKNFGTLSPCVLSNKTVCDVQTREFKELPIVRSVKFYPHESFRLLAIAKEKAFQESEKLQEKGTGKKKVMESS